MLATLGLDELVTKDLKSYETLALELARSPVRITEIREKLNRMRASSTLYDMAKLCRHVEKAYMTMWDIHQNGDKL